MRAGLMDRVITIDRASVTLDANGTPQTTWTVFATPYAQLIQRKWSADRDKLFFGSAQEVPITATMSTSRPTHKTGSRLPMHCFISAMFLLP